MCGINGFNFQKEDLIRKQTEATKHRGLDDGGIYCDKHISLGHNRLAIIDLSSSGHQPMSTEDGRYVIVFNGEIYNYRKIRKSLEEKGEKFRSTSDTEVVLKAYRRWGADCLKDFNGIFAFAIWDKHSRELFLARDQFGVKPLFYYHDGKRFIFSSEIKGILEHDIERKINKKALNTFFRVLYVNGPETVLENIYKLEPANYLLLKDGEITKNRYWQVDDYQNKYNAKQARELIRENLSRSIREQMVADVEVGVFLSGGIDSTIVLGLAREHTDKKLKTFSVGFDLDKPRFARFNEDYLLAKQTAEYYGTDHYDFLLKQSDVIDCFEKVVSHMDDLVYSPTQVANYKLAGMARKEVKVVLGGDGGDELFGGYERYFYYNIYNIWQKFPEPLKNNALTKKLFESLGRASEYQRLQLNEQELLWSFMSQKEELLSRVLRADFNSLEIAKNNFFANPPIQELFARIDIDTAKKLMNVDRKSWLVDFSLTRSDKMSMAHNLEQRVPFLDTKLCELAAQIPSRYKINRPNQGKKILIDAMRDYIPDHVYHKKKTGWFSPAAKWLRSGLKDYAREILSEAYNGGQTDEYLDLAEARQILEDHIAGRKYALNTIWLVMTFQVWYKHFMKN